MPRYRHVPKVERRNGFIVKIRNRFTHELVANRSARISWTLSDRLEFQAHLVRWDCHASTLDNNTAISDLSDRLGVPLTHLRTRRERIAFKRKLIAALQYSLESLEIELSLNETWDALENRKRYDWPHHLREAVARGDWQGFAPTDVELHDNDLAEEDPIHEGKEADQEVGEQEGIYSDREELDGEMFGEEEAHQKELGAEDEQETLQQQDHCRRREADLRPAAFGLARESPHTPSRRTGLMSSVHCPGTARRLFQRARPRGSDAPETSQPQHPQSPQPSQPTRHLQPLSPESRPLSTMHLAFRSRAGLMHDSAPHPETHLPEAFFCKSRRSPPPSPSPTPRRDSDARVTPPLAQRNQAIRPDPAFPETPNTPIPCTPVEMIAAALASVPSTPTRLTSHTGNMRMGLPQRMIDELDRLESRLDTLGRKSVELQKGILFGGSGRRQFYKICEKRHAVEDQLFGHINEMRALGLGWAVAGGNGHDYLGAWV
ncbi:hypothetical protein QBC47DRAFT_439746 [Echria macrotheca]|uniref:Uncharacterized protein n=1 Tax=Echria macrotheca TaxID=438768 RepID=A0AAJ0F1F1_9PEZI|nr:hypothetical protein QBC47DRAFT_439746 [Echria macrotheca]